MQPLACGVQGVETIQNERLTVALSGDPFDRTLPCLGFGTDELFLRIRLYSLLRWMNSYPSRWLTDASEDGVPSLLDENCSIREL